MSVKCVFYGASRGATGLEENQFSAATLAPIVDVVAFIDDFVTNDTLTIGDRPVINFQRWQRDYAHRYPVFVTIADPHARRMLVEKIAAAGGRFTSIADPPRSGSTYGEGVFVAGLTYVGPRVRLGQHAQILPVAYVGHGSTLADYSIICPAAKLAPCTSVGAETFIGARAILAKPSGEPLRIGRDVRIYAGAIVTHDVPDGAVLVGDPVYDPRVSARSERRNRLHEAVVNPREDAP